MAPVEEDDPPLFPHSVKKADKQAVVAVPGQDVPLLGAYMRALERAPILTKIITSVVIMGSSQYVAQRLAKGFAHDRKGITIWALWGFILGFFNHHWQALIAQHGPKSLVPKLAVDHVLWKVPILYMFVVYDRKLRGLPLRQAWRESVAVNPAIQWTAVKVFPLIQVLNFKVVPLPLRVLYMNTTLFFWCLYLAVKMK
mmetsp:Transcript_104850/g.306217  ORF Transcript_104850/g.306217 Transcript_104850/m.306217 type:complete len:198 (+) Transcript_104850:30-623(+)